MDFYEAVAARRSCRAYKSEKIGKDVLDRILSAFRQAPSWKNMQCWHLIQVSDPELKKQLGVVMQDNPSPTAYTKAPYVFVLCADPAESGNVDGKPYYMTDCGIALEHFCLAAAAEGLGTCWVGLFEEEPVRKQLHIPAHLRVVALTPLGVPDSGCYRDRPRRDTDDIVHENIW